MLKISPKFLYITNSIIYLNVLWNNRKRGKNYKVFKKIFFCTKSKFIVVASKKFAPPPLPSPSAPMTSGWLARVMD